MIDIFAYHWVWYLLGFIACPRITVMIFLSIHVPGLPLWLMIVGWFFAITHSTDHKREGNKTTYYLK